MSFDPGRLPDRQLLREAQRADREIEAQAELHAQIDADRKARASTTGGLRRVVRRVRLAISRQR